MVIKKRHQIFLITLFLFFSIEVQASLVKGIYGIPSIKEKDPLIYISQLKKAGVNAVFVPADKDTISFFKEHGLKVFISVNAFGGRSAWKKYPDARPLKSDGTLLGSEPGYKGRGGICPTHRQWRTERLKYIEKLITQFPDIDGIWLDFIRYPGLWEVKNPEIPDTCYCRRCLKQFQDDMHLSLPEGLNTTDASLWIKNNCSYDWMKWKKKQISSFVKAVGKLVKGIPSGKDIKLGLFLVPWTKGERQNAISFRLAQDAFELSQHVDVISPMVYHKMCGQPASWVDDMTRYYKEGANCKIRPIVQSQDCSFEEFSHVLKYAGQAMADGILIFSFKHMTPDLWHGVKAFQRPANFVQNPDFHISTGYKLPSGWKTGKIKPEFSAQSFFSVMSSNTFPLKKGAAPLEPESYCIGISAGNDNAGVWYSALPDCEPGEEYLFKGLFYRYRWENGKYPYISLWGQESRISSHWLSRTFQPIQVYVTCPDTMTDPTIRFINHNIGETMWLTRPRLTRNFRARASLKSQNVSPDFFNEFFPIGVYGAQPDNLEQLKSIGINTVIAGGHGQALKNTILKCKQLGLKYVITVPRDPDRLYVFLNEISKYVLFEDTAFYVNDEPGIHSFPTSTANDIQRLIKDRFPMSATCMAVVRPQVCRDYLQAADFFMMDQYPVPYMPMIWLSDSMDRAGKDVGKERLASVIQAFGGEKWKSHGWPRMPTWQEMDCLAFLSVIHGSRAIFFFTFNEIGKTEKGRQRLSRVVGRLNGLYPWLKEKNLDLVVNVKMVSRYKVDSGGSTAIHCCFKKKGDQVLLLATNTIGTCTEAVFQLPDLEEYFSGGVSGDWKEVFSQMLYPVINGKIRSKFNPYETKAFVLKAYRSADFAD